jgi:amino acid transporter
LYTLVSVAAIYIAMSVAVGGAAPLSCTTNGATALIAGTQMPATCPGMAGYLGGPAIEAVFTFGVIASIIGCAIGGLLSCARIVFAIAKTGFFPKQLATVNEDKAPICALWFQCLVMTAVGITANLLSRYGLVPDAYTFLAEVFAFLYSFLAIFYGVSLVVLRRASTEAKPKLPAIAAIAVMVIYSALAFICVSPIHQMAGAGLLLLGAPLYLFNARQRNTSAL